MEENVDAVPEGGILADGGESHGTVSKGGFGF